MYQFRKVLWRSCFIYLFSLGMIFVAESSANEANCNSQAWYAFPRHATYEAGKDINVRMGTTKETDIVEMALYLNGKYIRTIRNGPFEWATPNSTLDPELRNMKPGTYKLNCISKDRCGIVFQRFLTFYVKPKNIGFVRGNPVFSNCNPYGRFTSPTHLATYPVNSNVYVRVDPQIVPDIQYIELFLNGTALRSEGSYPFEWGNNPSDLPLKKMHEGVYHLKCRIKTKCNTWKEFQTTFYVK